MKSYLLLFILIITSSINLRGQNSISYTKIGSGSPVIFLPGLGCKSSVWNNTVRELSSDHCCYMLNIAGFAGKPDNGEFSLNKISGAIISLIKKESLNKPLIIGHSLGGFIAIKTVSQDPDLFSGLIVIDAMPFPLAAFNPAITEEQAAGQGQILKNMILKQTVEEYKKTERTVLGNLITNETDIDTVLQWMITSDRKALAEATSEMISTDLRDALKNITCKTLVIGTWIGKEQLGLNKESVKSMFENQYKNLKDKTIIISNNSKHFVMLDTPEWLNKQIIGFITE